jgi:nitroimidazol reductase NimA-like FMN-containing flavoprotein (pyridoxamine 5'-phosphate oxidase superfamily)
MDENTPPIVQVSDEEAWELLRTTPVGRLATHAAGEVDIFPINYVVDGSSLVFRTAPGTKLLELTVHHAVAFEIDGWTEHGAWAVIVKGEAEELQHQIDIDRAAQLPLVPWIPTLKDRYVRITPTSVSARRFPRGPEPEVSYTF